ncbi:hypothetical protein GCM10011507_03810 [Edaphobacter acidisoli]|uniref:Glycosyl hydrolase family 95 N-terminal domain-containing protein n=1 Tax=Edaphobacter acidisoli TaxID=2040573 RepID=A0A916RJ45_9BACT|nr:hypothetical protein GCM10011507_03810 [Edaphobacter acidisoli]
MLTAPAFLPAQEQPSGLTLNLPAPVSTWEKGIPLGNGITGGLLWGDGGTVNLSLDRGDLWDLRVPAVYQRPDWTYATLERLVRAGDEKQIHAMFDNPYDELAYPTKLNAGRLVLTFPQGEKASRFTLDAHRAEGGVVLSEGKVSAIFAATQPVALLRISGPAPEISLMDPSGVVEKLGYAPAAHGQSSERGIHTRWLVQHAALGLDYAVVVASRTEHGTTEIAVAIVSNREGRDPVALGKRRVAKALSRGYDAVLAEHMAWWKNFWSTSQVRVPQEDVQQQYVLDKYFYGSASRADAPPMPLQGVWTADDGGLPPWKGDYHNDLNTQMMYIAAPEAGLYPEGESFLNFNWRLLPVYRNFARSFYGVPGAIVPGVEAINGKPLGGWAQYSLSPTMGAWVAQSFYLHWRYTMDPVFLRTRAYPFASEIGTALLALMKPGPDGKLALPLSSSPEMFDNSLKAWLPHTSNFDLALERWLYGALAEMADAQGDTASAAHWRGVLDRLGQLDVMNGALTIAPGIPLPFSHRHLSNLMSIYPLGLVDVDSEQGHALAMNSIDDFASKGHSAWLGYTYGWLACMMARTGNGDGALRYLDDYLRGFIFENGFHVNGDQSRLGLSESHYHPFTLEGNFLAMQAVQEMLLQSWGGEVRIFPAAPSQWQSASFEGLRAEGGYVVSAERRDGHTTSVSITASVDGILRLRDPFAGSGNVQWNRPVQLSGEILTVHMTKGQTLSGSTGRRQEAAPPGPDALH